MAFDTKLEFEALSEKWEVNSRAEDWRGCEAVAREMIRRFPGRVNGWNQLAHCLHKQGRTDDAHDTLLDVVPLFPCSSALLYNLAAYASLLHKLPEAHTWLEKALEQADSPQDLKALAMKDPDLKSMWDALKT
jgi:tetratricopeptide (TPR) repeat protein